MVLNAMRQGAKKGVTRFVLFGFMVMAVAGLVMMDVGGFFTGGPNLARGNVVTIGRDKLSAAEFDMMVRRVLARQNIDAQTAWNLGIIDRILESEISGNLLRRAAIDAGIEIGDATVAETVKEIVTPYVDANTSPRQALQRLLSAQGMSQNEFVGAIRGEMTNGIMRNAIALAGNVGSEAEARDLYQYTHEGRSIEALFLPHDRGLDVAYPEDAVLLPFYQAGQEKYAIPETRVITVALLTEETVREAVAVSDDELKAQYESTVEAYKVPEKRELEQGILSDRAQAEAVATRVRDGSDLKAAVKSETGKEDAYLGTAAFEQTGLAKDIAEQAFASDPGAVIGPVQTALGWHVLVMKGIQPARTRPFEEVRDDLRKSAQQSRFAEQMFSLSGQIDDGLAAGTPIEELAETLNLKLVKMGPLRADGSTADSREGFTAPTEDREQILATAFEMAEGESSHVLELRDGNYAAVRVDEINEKAYTPFEDVREELAQVWIQDQREVLNRQRAEKALARIQAGEVTLAQIAGDLKLTPRTFETVRAEEAAKPLTEATKKLFFATAVDEYAFAPAEGGFILGRVTRINTPDPAKASAEDLEKVRAAALASTQDEVVLMYLETLRKKYGVKINRGLLEQIYGRAAGDAG